jgi:hypothetical protein
MSNKNTIPHRAQKGNPTSQAIDPLQPAKAQASSWKMVAWKDPRWKNP